MLREATAYVALSRLSLPRRRGSPISPLCEGAERAGPILGRVVSKRNRVQGFGSRRKEEHTEMSAASAHPVRVEGRLDPELSRWLWLVKWLLAIPHFIALFFLFIAFILLSIVAFFAILFTGRYRRSIFDFNVGVLRWGWRVAYYSYGALATDRYPPFTLAPVTDYPASVEVQYPEQLSRGLVLVKWWLLSIPHYLILGVVVGGGGWFVWTGTRNHDGDGSRWGGAPGLMFLLVIFAAIALLFTTRYPRGIFDFVMGLNRWALR